MRQIITSLGMIVFVGAIVVGGTGAFFNDTETSTGNVFTAGSLDLQVDSVGHVNGLVCFNDLWHPEEIVEWNGETEELQLIGDPDVDGAVAAYNDEFPANVPQAGTACASTWAQTDLGPETFFEFADIKPGDNGENTISLHVIDNDAYACAIIDNMVDADNSQTEPELEDGDDVSDLGELSQELRFFAWSDDGDNIWEPAEGEVTLFSNTEGPASDVIDGVVYPLFTPDTGVMPAEETQYIGLYWCYGAVSTDNDVLSCDGAEVTNLTQTDSLTADFTFYVEQARNNADFTCPLLETDPDSQVQVTSDDLAENLSELLADTSSWLFYNDTNDSIMTIDQFASTGGANDIVVGPEGVGAAQMILDDGTQSPDYDDPGDAGNPRYNITTYQFSATPLVDIGSLTYRIYDASPSSQTPYLHFNIDFDNSDTWQRRLVQVPDGVVEDTWTVVDALADTWTISGGDWPVGVDTAVPFPGSTPRTWAEILSDYPTAAFRTTDSFFGVRVGHPGPIGEESYVDWIEFDGVTYNFEN